MSRVASSAMVERWLRGLLPTLALMATLIAAGARPATAGELEERALSLLYSDLVADAQPLVARIVEAHPDAPLTHLVQAELAFRTGDYARARQRLDGLGAEGGRTGLRTLVDGTWSVVSGFREARSPGGHFVVRHAPGLDEQLLPYAFEALEAARREIGIADFGAESELADIVRVEILPEAADLAKLSSLTEREIETSGTIALCKYNKLMITSPRALVYGYPWLDTLAHEYTHFVLTRVSKNRAPIWLQEGIAKFEEQRWRRPRGQGDGGSGLSPMMEHLLASALAGVPDRKGGRPRRLIELSEMYPSMAKLPSQEDTALAFAEVYTQIDYLQEKRGWDAVRRFAWALRGNAGARPPGMPPGMAAGDGAHAGDGGLPAALLSTTGLGFDTLQSGWKAWLRGKKLRMHPGIRPRALKFGKKSGAGGAGPSNADETISPAEIAEERARRHVRLGGLLKAQGRTAACADEYEKAQAIVGPGHAPVATRLSRVRLALGQPDAAIAAALPAFQLDPTDGELALLLGEAHRARKAPEKAAPYYEAAIGINPFDPSPHCALAEHYATVKDPRAAREQAACSALRAP